MAADYPFYHPKTRKEWRQWLERNHLKAAGVWLVFYKKKSGKRCMTYDESVEEALCFGWIDSLPKTIDQEKSALKFTPRKPKSVWSKLNKTRIEELMAKGLLMPAGLAAIELAKENGSWDTLTASDKAAETNTIPSDLEKLFTRNKKAKENFAAFSFSVRKQFLYWIDSARRPETREARLKQTVRMAAAKKKPGAKGFVL